MTQTTLVKWQVLACVGLVWQVYSGSATAQSTAGSFSSVVTIGGSVKQEANGSSNTQVINAGGMNASKTGSFNSTVSVGGITQTTTGSGGVQTLNAGSMSNSSAGSFTANVNAGKLEQTGKGGERQEMDIGSVTNSTVSGSVNTTVNVRQGVKQVGEGEIAIGAVKNSNIGSFNNSITVNKVEGNNVRIGSVVGGSVYDTKGRLLNNGMATKSNTKAADNNKNSLQLPNFEAPTESNQQPLTGAGSTSSRNHKYQEAKSGNTSGKKEKLLLSENKDRLDSIKKELDYFEGDGMDFLYLARAGANPINRKNEDLIPKGWEMQEYYDEPLTGLGVAVYKRNNMYVMVFSNMDPESEKDRENVGSHLRQATPVQYDSASDVYSIYSEKIKSENPNAEIVLVGHSLGGGIAEYVGSTIGVPAVTFGSIGLNFSSLISVIGAEGSRENVQQIFNFQMKTKKSNDIAVNNPLAEHVGHEIAIGAFDEMGTFEAHAIDSYINYILALKKEEQQLAGNTEQ